MTSCRLALIGLVLAGCLWSATAAAEGREEYEVRVRLMLDFVVRADEALRTRLGDRGLASWVQAMCETNARQAERMTPPPEYAALHPHLLLVLENVERAAFHAAQGSLARYRHHQKIVRKELSLVETLAERQHLDPFYLRRSP